MKLLQSLALPLCVMSLAILEPVSCWAQLDLTWRNCVIAADGEPAPTSDQVFDCSSTQQYVLVASFKVPVAISSRLLHAYIELGSEAPGDLAPFWQFQYGTTAGCNGGLSASATRDQTGGCTAMTTAFTNDGAPGFAGIGEYVIDPRERYRAGMLVFASGGLTPHLLRPGVNYYAFHLVFSTSDATKCSGCDHPIAIVWSEAKVFGHESPDIRLTGRDKGSSCVTINGASAATCITTPTRNQTWGAIKALYR